MEIKMTITLFVNPEKLTKFLFIAELLSGVSIESNYNFDVTDLDFSETFNPDATLINLSVEEYLKLKYFKEKKENTKYNFCTICMLWTYSTKCPECGTADLQSDFTY